MGKRLTQEEFIERAKLKHSDRYDYSKVEYIGSKNKIVIICKEHGNFNQIPDNHLKGFGCFECSKKDKSINNNDFIEKSLLIHNNKYNYSKTKYTNWCSEVIIICPEHGEFKQVANNHLNGKGCIKCAISYKSSSNQEFIKKANIKHNNRYIYSKINYINAHTKINIICPEHGNFKQTPNSHLNGKGCKKCCISYSKIENKWLDLLGVIYRQVKISKYKVDGYDPKTNTVYEFNGDFWHGNPKKYNKDDINPISKKTFGELYEKTLERENNIRKLGYNFISIWESDFLNEDVSS